MSKIKYEQIGKCSLCGKKQATIIYTKEAWSGFVQEFLCEDCVMKHKAIFK